MFLKFYLFIPVFYFQLWQQWTTIMVRERSNNNTNNNINNNNNNNNDNNPLFILSNNVKLKQGSFI